MKYLWCLFFLVSFPFRFLFRALGMKVNNIGFSVILADEVNLASHVSIGHFNIIRIHRLEMADYAVIGHLNFLNGSHLDVVIGEGARIHNQNKISNAEDNASVVTLRQKAAIGVKHFVDASDNVTIGANSMLAGADSQVWTHSYIFAEEGDEVYKITGEVVIGNNVYVGARATILPSVSIGDAATIAACACVYKSVGDRALCTGTGMDTRPYLRDEIIAKLKAEQGVPPFHYKKK